MQNFSTSNLPVATQWTLDAAGEVGRSVVPNIFMIVCLDTGSKGSGFLLKNGYIVTNLHVVNGSHISNILAISSDKTEIKFSSCSFYEKLDLILLKPSVALNGGLDIDLVEEPKIGESVYTWGYPLGYNGPAPLFSMGYLSGFIENNQTKHFVINGAFNNGNSGGALFKYGSDKIIGIVVSKHLPLSNFHRDAITVLGLAVTSVSKLAVINPNVRSKLLVLV
ncbi:MAG: serine protease [Candidatus Dependentiae bacterium]|nr:serine protease [Candidatus Dependentiae bacterium]